MFTLSKPQEPLKVESQRYSLCVGDNRLSKMHAAQSSSTVFTHILTQENAFSFPGHSISITKKRNMGCSCCKDEYNRMLKILMYSQLVCWTAVVQL